MLDTLNTAITSYKQSWQTLIDDQAEKTFLQSQKPTAVAWKTTDKQELSSLVTELTDDCDQIHWGWVNERWLVTMHLKDTRLAWDIQIIKLMQRRPGSSDTIGLDHIDFYSPANNDVAARVSGDTKLTQEQNGDHCAWTSVWFDSTEAKLRTDTVLDPCIAELRETKQRVLAST